MCFLELLPFRREKKFKPRPQKRTLVPVRVFRRVPTSFLCGNSPPPHFQEASIYNTESIIIMATKDVSEICWLNLVCSSQLPLACPRLLVNEAYRKCRTLSSRNPFFNCPHWSRAWNRLHSSPKLVPRAFPFETGVAVPPSQKSPAQFTYTWKQTWRVASCLCRKLHCRQPSCGFISICSQLN